MIRTLLRKIKANFVTEKILPVTVPVMEGSYVQNRIAFVSGATGGIGEAIAERFVANGAKVVLAGRNEGRLKRIAEKLGEGASYACFDLSKPKQFDAVVLEAVSKYGKIDILVNSGGVHGPSNFWSVTPDDWDTVMETNLKGMYFLGQAFGRYFRDNQIHGHILNISSASALKHGKTPYEISKNGVRSITLGMAEEMIRYGIVVNCLAPGPTATEMLHFTKDTSLSWPGNPSGRVATPDEIANWAVLMSSDMGNYVVGDSFYVTGGSGTICIDK